MAIDSLFNVPDAHTFPSLHLSTQNFDHYLVYWIAPTVGAVLATVLFAVFSASFLSDEAEKSKAD